jgi:hypothetical protein
VRIVRITLGAADAGFHPFARTARPQLLPRDFRRQVHARKAEFDLSHGGGLLY